MIQYQEATKINPAHNAGVININDRGKEKEGTVSLTPTAPHNALSTANRSEELTAAQSTGRHNDFEDDESHETIPVELRDTCELEEISKDSACIGNLAERYIPTLDFPRDDEVYPDSEIQAKVRHLYQIID